MHVFFGLGDPFEPHSRLWRLVSGSYWKNQLLSPVITHSNNSGLASTCSSNSAQMLTCASCCCVRFLGTILAQIFLIPNSSVSIRRTASRFTFTSSAIILTVNLRLDQTSSRTRAVLSLVRVVDGSNVILEIELFSLPSGSGDQATTLGWGVKLP